MKPRTAPSLSKTSAILLAVGLLGSPALAERSTCSRLDLPAGADACETFGPAYSVDQLPAVFTVTREGTDTCPGFSEHRTIRDAAYQWSTVPGSSFSFKFGGFEERSVGGLFPDGVQHLTFLAMNDGTLGKVWHWIPRQADVAFQDDDIWDCGGGDLSLIAVSLHQLGHALGLGHSTDPESVLNPNSWAEELSASDEECLRNLYPR